MADTNLQQFIINECDEVPETFEPNQFYLTPDTTDDDIAKALKQAKEYTDEALNNYALKSEIQVLNATDSITLTDGYIYNGGEQTALTIALPTSANVSFLVEIDFTSGSTPTTLTYPNTIKWSGDDVSNNVFTPVANKRYTMICYYNGVDFVFVTKGVVA